MKILQWILIGLLALFLLIGLGGYLLPATGEVERSVTIEAPAAAVYDVVSDLQQFNDWSPWANIDPNTEFEIVGTGVGSSMSWTSEDPSVGSGKMTISGLQPNERVDMDLDFGPDGVATSYVALDGANGSTTVTWGFETQFGANPYSRYFGLLIGKFVGDAYDEGLANLKKLVE